MAFKRSAVRSRLSPPKGRKKHRSFRFGVFLFFEKSGNIWIGRAGRDEFRSAEVSNICGCAAYSMAKTAAYAVAPMYNAETYP